MHRISTVYFWARCVRGHGLFPVCLLLSGCLPPFLPFRILNSNENYTTSTVVLSTTDVFHAHIGNGDGSRLGLGVGTTWAGEEAAQLDQYCHVVHAEPHDGVEGPCAGRGEEWSVRGGD